MTWEKCLCHCVEDEQGQLTEFAERSWQSFLKAAAIRRDATWSFLKANNIDLEGDSQPVRDRYHRRSYSIYTHKKALEACLLKQEKASSSSDGEGVAMDEAHTDDTAAAEKGASRDAGKRRFFTRSALPKVKALACLFCLKQGYKRQKGKSEPLTDCQTFQASERILQAARLRNDERVLCELEGGPDAIAAEVVYHLSCYRYASTSRSSQTGSNPSRSMPTPAQGSRSAGGEVSNVESSRENDSDSGQEQSSSSDLELSDSDMYTDSDSEGLHDFSSLRTVYEEVQ